MERSLVRRAREGDAEAFGKLYMMYLDPIYRYIYFRINFRQDDAEDIAETVFFKAWRNIRSFRVDKNGNMQAWLYTIARNCITDYYRTQKAHEQLDETIPSPQKNPEDALIHRHEHLQLQKALAALSEEQQSVVILNCIEGRSHAEIGKILSKDEEAVRALKYRAIKQLRKKLKA